MTDTLVSYDYILDNVGNQTAVIDPEGRPTTYDYDALNRVITITNPLLGETVYGYDAAGNRTTLTDAEQRTTTYQYDRLNRLRFTTLNYDSNGPTNFETNVTTEVIYDRLGRTAERIDGRGNSSFYSYDDLGRTRFVTDANGNTTETIYDGLGNRRFVINGEAEQTEFQYDEVNRLVAAIDDLGNETDYVYNKAGERTAMIDAETVETRYDYDDLSRLTIVTENYVNGGPVDNQTNVATQYGYDRVGNRTVITNARGYTTTYRYDDLNRRTHTIDALGNTTRYGYDQVGNREVITDANDIVTTFRYDDVYRLTNILYGDSTPDVTFTYDDVGNRETMTDGSGLTSYGYDELYRLDSVNDGASLQVSYQYDEVGNRTQLIYPGSVGAVSYDYDPGNRLITATNWLNGQFGYNYDDVNRMTGLSLPNGINSSYGYDDAGRLTLLAHSTLTDTLASYAYDLDGVGNRRVLTESLVTVQNLPAGAYLESNGQVVLEAENGDITNGLTHTWLRLTALTGYTGTSYVQSSPDIDALYQTSEITASPVVSYPINFTTAQTYTVWLRGYPTNAAGDSTYVSLGDQTVSVTGFAPRTWSWAEATAPISVTTSGVYSLNLWMREDGLRIDRLLLTTDTNFIPTDFGPPETERQLGGGSFITPLTRTIVYTYDNLYRLTDANYSTGQSYAYEYDPVGNRLQQIIDGDTTEYLYDAANRLEQLNGQSVYTFDDNGNLLNSDVLTNTWDAANRLIETERDGTVLEPIYNGVGDRVGQTVGVSTTNYALDIAAGLPEVVYTSEGNAYLHLPGVIVAESSIGEVRYLLSDGLGSVRQAIDETGEVMAYNEFDPYGNSVQGGGAPYGFTGEWWESDVNLLHLRARWYSPGTGTFLSVDPVESEPPYQYVSGNPVKYSDPSGKQPPRWCVFAPAAWAADGPLLPVGDVVTVYCVVAYAWAALGLGQVIHEFADPPPGIGVPPRPAYPITEPIPQPAPEASSYNDPEQDSPPTPGPHPVPLPRDNPFPPETCTPTPDDFGYKVLTLGDGGSFSYSTSLHARHPSWKITGTDYGNGTNSQTRVPGSIGNLKLYTNVDGTRLESGPETGHNRYDAIVFNAPRANAPLRPSPPHNRLIDNVLASAFNVLKPGGHIRFSSTGGMPAGPHLQRLVKPGQWPPGYSYANGGPIKWHGGGAAYRYFNNSAFGVTYLPQQNNGQPLTFDWSKFYWYVFVK